MSRFVLILSGLLIISCHKESSVTPINSDQAFSVSKGLGNVTISNLYSCTGGRSTNIGTVTSTDGKSWTVPAEVNFSTAAKATDLYNECSGVKLPNIASLTISAIPLITVDADGEEIVGYFFGDNYFELYVNGKLIAVDPVPYTPFNSCVVRFKAKKPFTYAIKLVDWEEKLGLGSEDNNGQAYHPGDGGFMASFSDGTITDATWKAQTFYIAPIDDVSLIEEKEDGTHSTAKCSTSPSCNGSCYAAHYDVPTNWFAPSFDDAKWPQAAVYSEATVGVDNKPAYTNFKSSVFSATGAKFIWSSNLILDNTVLIRKKVN